MDGIDIANVTSWFEANIAGVEPPLEFTLIAGGRSNLTFRVDDAGGHAFVLRRPPLGHVLPTAHDMGREHRIISALGPTAVPVPPALGFCDDDAVNGAPFYVMGFVEGVIARDAAAADTLTVEQRRRAGASLVDVLAAIHSVDPADVGLDDLGRHGGYIERQLKRWYAQFQQSKMREVPVVDEVHDFLLAHVPEQQGVAIVHGDYRLDNCIIGPYGDIVAVLDWELCTLGDPLADVGLLLVYWNDPDDFGPASLAGGSATALEGFPRRADLRRRYEEVAGRDTSKLDFYVAFGYWKLACILDGVYTRYAKGAMGKDGAGWEAFGESVARLAEQAKRSAEGLA
ncbi:MAG TPA: phosphotransferase family protein [Acidimicrobiales bacterium]|nr:phosphotransferase family protein [Acidimicrobiales bacterium]